MTLSSNVHDYTLRFGFCWVPLLERTSNDITLYRPMSRESGLREGREDTSEICLFDDISNTKSAQSVAEISKSTTCFNMQSGSTC
ncbi:hypothetical protein RRG08_008743 [Elysia crispata]|uniref:Uncharacterized protein n=1 Tax=Elysia crispata TaxID=231223 RepID=A0AAE0YV70_9GAST|nr:hypothetical protein RRG08_008743 [Elysia crispata]